MRNGNVAVAALVPIIAESYGIHKFLISMLRAMYSSSSADELLQPLKERFFVQHRRLYEFYADCSSIRYLTTLITIPKIPYDPPNLTVQDDGTVITPPTQERAPESPEPTPQPIQSQPTGAITDAYIKAQRDFELEQQKMEQERQAQLLQQQQQQQQQQQYWAEQQRQQAETQMLAQQQLLADQVQRQAQGRVAELERDLLALRGQYDKDQLMLEQYDQRVQALEQEIGNTSQTAQQQIASRDEQLTRLQEQVTYWKNKYESLAKLYTQLRQEHLNLLTKFKKIQQKASSAQEAIDKREKLEKEMKAKNIELADLIRERDRAKLELDRLKSSKNKEYETLELRNRDLEDRLATTERAQSSNLSSIFAQHNKEIDDLQKRLQNSLSISDPNRLADLENKLREKEMELEMTQQTMEETIKDLASQQHETDEAMNNQIDEVLQAHVNKLSSLIDSLLKAGADRIQDAVFELDSPMQAGNYNASPEYLATLIEKCSDVCTDFAKAFSDYIVDGPEGDQVAVINTITTLTTAIAEILLNTKGLTRLTKLDDYQDDLVDTARDTAEITQVFFEGLLSENLQGLSIEDQTDKAINGNIDVQEMLQALLQLVESLKAPNNRIDLNNVKGELSDLVDREMASASKAIDDAFAHLNDLLLRPIDPTISAFDTEINKSILASAMAIINAIKLLIQASIASQEEIV
ncbi:unnamed protein product [Ambrosiozyma monospora]|uniref:Unnamed protein product n=1 Tax=Ambrosiozyma monospora TaxID=43982 RepID=A0A9W6Z6V5_AMBMO|nr:unnamed protein product [Ambrosiozyma monospora]